MTERRRKVKRKQKTNGKISLRSIFLLLVLLMGAAWFFGLSEDTAAPVKTSNSSEISRLRIEDKEQSAESTVKKWMKRIESAVDKETKKGVSITEEEPNIVKEKPKEKGTAVHAKKPTSTVQGEVTGRLAVVIDDAGYDLPSQRIYESLGVPFTLAIMPNKSETREAAKEWTGRGMEAILHQPMEPVSGMGMEDKTILTSMSDEEIRQMFNESLDQLPEIVGVNNHQGSKATIDYHVMSIVSEELAKRNLFFLDSHTNTTTVADKTCLAFGVPYAKNGLFVDNSTDEREIRKMIQEGANRAKTHGTYIIIGHCRPHTAAAFRDMVPELLSQGIQFIYVSSLVK